jgi:hypothetical protein
VIAASKVAARMIDSFALPASLMPEPLLPSPLVMPPELVVQQHLPATTAAATAGTAAETSGTSEADAAAADAAAGANRAAALHSPHTVSSRRNGTAPPVLAVGKQQHKQQHYSLKLQAHTYCHLCVQLSACISVTHVKTVHSAMIAVTA